MLCDFETKSLQFCSLLLMPNVIPEDISISNCQIWTFYIRFEDRCRHDNEMEGAEGENNMCKSERIILFCPRDFQFQVKEIGEAAVDILVKAWHCFDEEIVVEPGDTEGNQTGELSVAQVEAQKIMLQGEMVEGGREHVNFERVMKCHRGGDTSEIGA